MGLFLLLPGYWDGLLKEARTDASQEGHSHFESISAQGCDLSWNDTTASELGKGYDRGTIHVMTCSSLNHLDSTSLLPGDMAVTTSGIHVMAYLGRNKWIGADPRRWRLRFS
jgi:hypothetical protein